MPREIASKTERLGRIRKGYLAAGRKGLKNTRRLFGGTQVEKHAGWSTAKNALDKNMHLKPHVRKKKKTAAEQGAIDLQKAYDERERRKHELRMNKAWKPGVPKLYTQPTRGEKKK